MQNEFDKLNRIFGVNGDGQEPPQGADAPLPDTGPAEDGGLPEGAEEPAAPSQPPAEDAVQAQDGPAEDAGGEVPAAAADEGPAGGEDESERRAMGLLHKLDSMIYDPEKHEQRAQERKKRRAERRRAEEEEEELTERDFRPVRQRRDGRLGCMGGIMYFAFVVSVSVILAAVGWMAAMDVLALNKPQLTAVITLPDEIFSEVEVEITDDEGNVTGTETELAADIDYVADVLKSAGLIEYKPLFKLFCDISHAATDIDPGTYELNTTYDYNALVLRMRESSAIQVTVELMFPEGSTMAKSWRRTASAPWKSWRTPPPTMCSTTPSLTRRWATRRGWRAICSPTPTSSIRTSRLRASSTSSCRTSTRASPPTCSTRPTTAA